MVSILADTIVKLTIQLTDIQVVLAAVYSCIGILSTHVGSRIRSTRIQKEEYGVLMYTYYCHSYGIKAPYSSRNYTNPGPEHNMEVAEVGK